MVPMQHIADPDTDREADAIEDVEESLEKMAKVFVHNDDVTPYDFVIMVLIRFFKLPPSSAERITWQAHTSGNALVSILPLAEAHRRVGRAHFAASLEGYPLTFTVEPN